MSTSSAERGPPWRVAAAGCWQPMRRLQRHPLSSSRRRKGPSKSVLDSESVRRTRGTTSWHRAGCELRAFRIGLRIMGKLRSAVTKLARSGEICAGPARAARARADSWPALVVIRRTGRSGAALVQRCGAWLPAAAPGRRRLPGASEPAAPRPRRPPRASCGPEAEAGVARTLSCVQSRRHMQIIEAPARWPRRPADPWSRSPSRWGADRRRSAPREASRSSPPSPRSSPDRRASRFPRTSAARH